MTKLIGLTVLAGALAAGAAAQKAGADPFDYHASNVRLLMDKDVQKELNVTEAQRQRMNIHADAHRSRLKQYEEKLRRTNKAPSRLDPEFLTIMETLKKNVLAELQPAQLKRLREISLQTIGLVAVLDDKVAEKIGVTDAQLKKLRELYKEGQGKAQGLVRNEVQAALAEFKDAKPKNDAEKKALQDKAKAKMDAAEKRLEPQVSKIRAETRNKILAAMTEQQKNAFKALQGKPFKGAA